MPLTIDPKKTNNVWVEKYRPIHFSDIVLGETNKKILSNILDTKYFPNLLLYGPPGTGKTTTIINLINEYQRKTQSVNRNLIIHLNASDERGIDIIRNQINSFVNTKPLFNDGMKFVILDEVDYMTKIAQQALRCLLQTFETNVRFCLICNYISKIDNGLQTEFIRLRFNQLDPAHVMPFLKQIVEAERLCVSDSCLTSVMELYKSDIRSMINFIQSNESRLSQPFDQSNPPLRHHPFIVNNDIWNKLLEEFQTSPKIATIAARVCAISECHNMDKKNVIKDFVKFVIEKNKIILTSPFLSFVENLIHSKETDTEVYVMYAISTIQLFVVPPPERGRAL